MQSFWGPDVCVNCLGEGVTNLRSTCAPVADPNSGTVRRAQLQEHYEFADFAAKAALAVLLKHLPLSLPELWLFCHSPTDPQEPHMVSALLTFVTAFCYR